MRYERSTLGFGGFMAACLLSLVLEAPSARAQDAARKEPKKSDKSWKWRFEAGFEVTYDDNVFKLSDDQIDRLEDELPADDISGRFDDMDSVDDVIFTPSARARVEGPGIGGRDLRIRPRLQYEIHAQNTKKSHPELGVDFLQSLGSGRSVELDLGYAPGVFTKNYLEDATDLTDSVSADERVYDEGVYGAFELEAAYRHRLWRRPEGTDTLWALESVYGRVATGYRNVSYDDPFENRDLDGFHFGLGVEANFGEVTEVTLQYVFASVMAPNDTEVVLRDEPDFGVDFNGDLDVVDQNIRTVQRVDRSRLEHGIRLRGTFRVSDTWSVWAGYDVLFQDFTSDEPFDQSYRDRDDVRHRLRAGAQWRFAEGWTLDLQIARIEETISKRAVAAEEEDQEYERYILSAAVSRRF